MIDFKAAFGKLFDVEDEYINDYSEESMTEENYEESNEEEYMENNQFVGYTDFKAEEEVAPRQEERFYQQPAKNTPVYASTVIMLSPYDIRTSQVVAEHIRQGHIVICNLTSCTMNQRIVDYISGAVFALDGKIEPTPIKTTFVCTPKNVELIVDSKEEEEQKVSAL